MNKLKVNALTKQLTELTKKRERAYTDYLLARDQWRGIVCEVERLRREILEASRD